MFLHKTKHITSMYRAVLEKNLIKYHMFIFKCHSIIPRIYTFELMSNLSDHRDWTMCDNRKWNAYTVLQLNFIENMRHGHILIMLINVTVSLY